VVYDQKYNFQNFLFAFFFYFQRSNTQLLPIWDPKKWLMRTIQLFIISSLFFLLHANHAIGNNLMARNGMVVPKKK